MQPNESKEFENWLMYGNSAYPWKNKEGYTFAEWCTEAKIPNEPIRGNYRKAWLSGDEPKDYLEGHTLGSYIG